MDFLALGLALVGVLVAIAVPLLIEKKRRPALRIQRADDADQPNHPLGAFRIVHIRVINEPVPGRLGRLLLRNVATSCKVTIRCRSRKDGSVVGFPGRWSGTPQPLSHVLSGGNLVPVYDPEKALLGLRFDLSSDEEGEVLAVAIKWEGNPEAHGFSAESYRVADLSWPPYELSDEVYAVEVSARAGGISVERTFSLHNEGTAVTGLRLIES